jgi:hypothetical protein
MSNATIVSIAPCIISRSNPSIVPPDITIPQCFDESEPVFHHVVDVKTIEYIPMQQKGKGGRLNPISGLDYARSVVNDFINSIVFASSAEDASPGVIVVENHVAAITGKTLEDMQARQQRWKDIVISKTDDLWNKFGQRKFIMELAVVISKQMNLDREWARKASDSEMKICPACMTTIHPMASICANCRTIVNPDRYKKFQLAIS